MKLTPIASNMTELRLNDGTMVLFSYRTPVACAVNGTFFRTSYKWSRTTSKHINKWLCGSKAEEKPQEYFDNITGGL